MSGTDEAFLRFLHARLREESRADVPPATLTVVHELMWTIEHGGEPDQLSLGLLTMAYADHPDFRPEWNRWRR